MGGLNPGSYKQADNWHPEYVSVNINILGVFRYANASSVELECCQK